MAWLYLTGLSSTTVHTRVLRQALSSSRKAHAEQQIAVHSQHAACHATLLLSTSPAKTCMQHRLHTACCTSALLLAGTTLARNTQLPSPGQPLQHAVVSTHATCPPAPADAFSPQWHNPACMTLNAAALPHTAKPKHLSALKLSAQHRATSCQAVLWPNAGPATGDTPSCAAMCNSSCPLC
jgi:hypothetical protein